MALSEEAFPEGTPGNEATHDTLENRMALARAAEGRGEFSGEGFGEDQSGFSHGPHPEARHDESPDNVIGDSSEQSDASS